MPENRIAPVRQIIDAISYVMCRCREHRHMIFRRSPDEVLNLLDLRMPGSASPGHPPQAHQP